MNPYLDRLNEISATLKERMDSCDSVIFGSRGGAPIAFASPDELEELHVLRLKLQEMAAIHAAGAKERIAERIRNRRTKPLKEQQK